MKKREPKEYVIQPKGWRKKYKCHKNKNDHTFDLVYAQHYNFIGWRNVIHEYYVCNACGKKSMKSVPW